MEHNTWLVVERYENWRVDKRMGFRFLGFPERNSQAVKQMQKGDKIVIYIASKKSKLAAIYEVVSESPYYETALVWDEIFPVRIKIHPEIVLDEGTFVSIKELVPKLGFIKNKEHWRLYFYTTLKKLTREDYAILYEAIKQKAIIRKG